MRLELEGDFEVLVAENGERGCEMAASERPDIILMDLEMPVMDGWEATRQLKNNPRSAWCRTRQTPRQEPFREFERLLAAVQRLCARRK
jgi:CheY-like chemotaxis protein